MRLAHPEILWLLCAVVPVLVVGHTLAFARGRALVSRLGDSKTLARMASSVSHTRRIVRAVLMSLALVLIVIALARPQASGRAVLQKQYGLDLVVALDFSKSMLAKDIYPSRLERAKRELEWLLDELAGDRVGLVAFAGETLTYPPTTDYAAVKLFWRDMEPSDMPVGGTAVGRALTASLGLLKSLREKGGKTRAQVILLLTDGEDTDSEPLAAAAEAAQLGIKIYAVGIGSRSGELIPQVDETGEVTGYLKDKSGKYVTSRLAEGVLSELASQTEGLYLRADSGRFGVEQIRAALAALKRSENDARLVRQYDEIYLAFLVPALLLLVGQALMTERKRTA